MSKNISFLGCFFIFLLFYDSCEKPNDGFETLPSVIVDYIHQSKPNSLFRLGDSLKYQQNYKEACIEYEKLFDHTSVMNLSDQYYFYNQLSYLYLKLYQFNKASQLIKESQQIATTQGMADADRALNTGMLLLENNKGQQGANLLWKADSLYRGMYGEKHLKLLETQLALGLHYYEEIKLDSLELCINKATRLIEANQAFEPFRKNWHFLKAKASLYEKNHEGGLLEVDLAIQEATTGPLDTVFIGLCYTLRSHLLRKLNKGQSSQEMTKKILTLSKGMAHYPKAMLIVYEDLALQAMGVNDTTLFFSILDSIRLKFDHFANGQQNPDCLLAYYCYKEERYDEAISLYEKLVEEYKSLGIENHSFFDEAYYILCESYRQTRRYEVALQYNQLGIENLIGDRKGTMEALKAGNYLAGISPALRHTLTIFLSKIPVLKYEQYQSASLNGEVLKKAVLSFVKLDSLFFVHSQVMKEAALLEFGEEHFSSTYEVAISASFKAYEEFREHQYLEYANLFIERLKYSGLARGIVRKNALESLPDTLAISLKQIEKKLDQLCRQKFEHTDQETFAIDYQIRKQEQLRDRFITGLQTKVPGFFSNHRTISIPTILEAKSRITQPVLQYYITQEQLYCIVIRPDTIIVNDWSIPAKLDTLVTTYNQLISKTSNAFRPEKFNDYINLSYELYTHLLAPVIPALGVYQSVVIIPDANFPQLPFESLLRELPTSAKADYLSLDFMNNHYSIAHSYSLKSLLQNNRQKKASFETPDILAYSFSKENLTENNEGNLSRGQTMKELPGAVIDLAAIKENFGGSQTVSLRYGKEATLQSFYRDVENRHDIIHLALHASSSQSNRWNNHIYFPSNKADSSVDTLFSTEIAYFSLSDALVVLSACETGIGSEIAAEGVFSLARSCFTAGASQVVASLWRIQDDTSSSVITYFYHYLKTGQTVQESLHRAKQDYLRHNSDAYLSFPGFWSGLICFI